MRSSGKTTLADVAARAGVSTITVSRALRTPSAVSERARASIHAAVKELGYVPNPAARMLATGRSEVIGVLIPSVTNSVFTEVLQGIYATAEQARYSVQLGNTRYDPEIEHSLVSVFLSQNPAGLVVSGIDQSDATRSLLGEAGCPIVQIMETGPAPIDMMVGFSHEAGGASAAEHLLAEGYRRLAIIGARMDPRSQRRLEGFRARAEVAGAFSPARCLSTEEPSTTGLGAQLFARLLRDNPETDAVFCNNDDLALGVLFEAQRQGVAVPERVGICGFNDLEIMSTVHPSITSVQTNRLEMGERAVEMIHARARGDEIREPVVDLGCSVVARASTGCEPAAW